MNCMESRTRLHPYLDQELDLPGTMAIDQHLAGCEACRTIFAGQAALRSGIRRHAEYYAAPPALAHRIRAKIGGAPSAARAGMPARRPWFQFPQWLRVGAAVAAMGVASWIAAIQYSSPGADQLIAEQVISSHARAVLGSRLVDVASSDQHTVKPWLSGKLDFSPSALDLTGAGFPLLGGRLDYLDNRPVATLVYRHRQHVIDLYIWPDARSGRALQPQSSSKNGYNLLHWANGGMVYWAISDLNPAELKTFGEAYSDQARAM
jgi:anti-sigma factor RsiW